MIQGTKLSGKTMMFAVMTGLMVLAVAGSACGQVSDATDECLTCHRSITPGLVAGWEKGRHATTTVQAAFAKDMVERRISAGFVPDSLTGVVIGCAECHTLNADSHEDSFEHNGYTVHTVVTPADCGVCHPVERAEYTQNLMSHAYDNLMKNDLYQMLMGSINDIQSYHDGDISVTEAGYADKEQSCLFCHGTKVTVAGVETRDTDLGEMDFPVLTGWPNRGVGRVNPDGTSGSCSPCHARHQFSIEMARQPYTCSECHKGPDVPAYKVYSVSKHGNIFSTHGKDWDFDAVPWVVGRDFTAPTCAVCHVSLVQDEEGEVVSSRSHRMNDRLPYRLLGLIYAHPHPLEPNTSIIKNNAGLPLPTELTGEPVMEYLIDSEEMEVRESTMKQICLSCHSQQWADNHFVLLDSTVASTNQMTLTATQILLDAWDEGLALGPGAGYNPFDETLERMWVEQWLYYSNTVRLASAMAGADYGVFANGRFFQSKTVRQMHDWLKFLRAAKE